MKSDQTLMKVEDQRSPKWLRWGGTFGGQLVHPPLLKQGQLELVAPDHAQMVSELRMESSQLLCVTRNTDLK